MQISSTVQLTGASHLTTQHKHGLRLKTEHGQKFYQEMKDVVNEAYKAGNENQCLVDINKKREALNKKISNFLNDDAYAKKYKLDERDTEGWLIYHKLCDEYDTLTHFLKGKR